MTSWTPKVERFYQDTLTSLRSVGAAAQDWANGTSQPNEMQTAVAALGQCEANLAKDTGVTPNVAAAQNAMVQLHSACSLLTKAAGEIGSLDATLIVASEADVGAAVDLVRSVLTSLGQPAQ